MAADIRYRYKGKFVSARDAQRIANLKSASKYLTHEYTLKGRSEISRRGYKPPIEKQIQRALKSVAPIAKPPSKSREAEIKKREQEKQNEYFRLMDIVEKAVKKSYADDIDIDDAADSVFDPASFQFYDYGDFSDLASAYDADEAMFEFDMADLENEDKYPVSA